MKHLWTALLISALASLGSGCMVRATPAAGVVTTSYSPSYYEGGIVYYDEYGAPYVYRDHVVYYVPRRSPQFNVLVGHYHKHRAEYHRWYRDEGRRNVERHRRVRKAVPYLPEPRYHQKHRHHRR